MRRILLEVEYHGQAFFGWQRQGSARSVQATLEAAIADLVGHRADVHGAGRTDRGVHALAMPAHVDMDSRLRCEELVPALNVRLPQDCVVRRAREVDPRFHARFDARSKHYRYRFYLSRTRSPMLADRAYMVPRALDIDAMREAAALLAGTRDFACFRTNPEQDPQTPPDDEDASDTTADLYGPAAVAHGDFNPPPWRKPRPQGTTRTIFDARLNQRGNLLDLDVRGDGFLRGMVRAMAGTLLEIGLGKQPPTWVTALLAGRDRRDAGANLPPHGLTLVSVDYPPEPFGGDST
ncbi:MAG: tRNA pseudouridine synthase A [Planctomycetes bacterium]|jgi:tRNA pseudouridine38-40 synthase|nr:tRNA pseudouridine synthase A [Planctomycetota bacterium]MCL4729951.1 tRNA pseudouridine(38-40) synthase TruA [Planctomycetota bacterium]